MHKEHRKRVKDRFLKEGLENFEPHNILEMLLFYSIPQKDTNETAHLLLDKFGSISAVFDASYQDLMTVPGIKEHSATLIKMIPQIAQKYVADKNDDSGLILSSIDKIGRFFKNKYISATNEIVYLLLLDNKLKIIDCIKLHEGSVNSSAITMRSVVEAALRNNASSVVLAHNHPQGIAVPSPDDIYTTENVKNALSLMGINFLAHILVAGNKYTNILKD